MFLPHDAVTCAFNESYTFGSGLLPVALSAPSHRCPVPAPTPPHLEMIAIGLHRVGTCSTESNLRLARQILRLFTYTRGACLHAPQLYFPQDARVS